MEWTALLFDGNLRALLHDVVCVGSFSPWAAGARGLCQARPRRWLRAHVDGKPGWAEPAQAWAARSKAVSFFK